MTMWTLPTTFSHMADLGFTELSMEPVVSPPGEPWALTQEDLPKLFQQYELLAQEMLKRDRRDGPSPSTTTCWTWRGPCLHKRMSGCGSGHGVSGGDPGGSSSPATSLSTTPFYSMGDVWKGITNPQLGRNSTDVTWWPTPTAGTAGPSCTAPAAVPPTPTTPAGTSTGPIPTDASCSKTD